MNTPVIVLNQTLTMGIYMLLGYWLFKIKRITLEGTKTLANILIWLITPAMVIESFAMERTAERLEKLGISTLLAAVALGLSLLAARLIYRKRPEDRFAAAYSNCGYFGIPLVRAALGDEAVFLIVGYVALLNLLQMTHGVSVLKREKLRFLPGQFLRNPVILGVLIGAAVFLTGLGPHIPAIPRGVLKGISAMNAPVAMLLLGTYLAQADLKRTLTDLRLYAVSCVRLLLIPLLTLGVLFLIPADPEVRLAALLAAAAPVGTNAAVYAQMYGGDYTYECQAVALSTVLCIASMPLMTWLAGFCF